MEYGSPSSSGAYVTLGKGARQTILGPVLIAACAVKILFLPSHVGLGHVARDLAVARLLSRLRPGAEVEWCTAEPAASMVRAWGERIVDDCGSLGSFSGVVEDFSERGALALGRARRSLEVLRRNYECVAKMLPGYDLVFADEFWELVYSAPSRVKASVVFGTDLVYMPYLPSLAGITASLVLNAYFKRALAGFRRLLYLNDPGALGNARWYLFAGGRVREWVDKHCISVGLATSYLPWELPGREEARRRLGVGGDVFLVVATVGGTSARSRVLLDKVEDAVGRLKARLSQETEALVVTGPRTRWVPRRERLRVDGFKRSLVDYYAAADVLVTRAGRTTTADLICSGANAVIVPIRGHMEQESIARGASKTYGYTVLGEKELEPRHLAEAIIAEAGKTRRKPHRLCEGVERAARILLSLLGA